MAPPKGAPHPSTEVGGEEFPRRGKPSYANCVAVFHLSSRPLCDRSKRNPCISIFSMEIGWTKHRFHAILQAMAGHGVPRHCLGMFLLASRQEASRFVSGMHF